MTFRHQLLCGCFTAALLACTSCSTKDSHPLSETREPHDSDTSNSSASSRDAGSTVDNARTAGATEGSKPTLSADEAETEPTTNASAATGAEHAARDGGPTSTEGTLVASERENDAGSAIAPPTDAPPMSPGAPTPDASPPAAVGECQFSIDVSLSDAIGQVGIVEWSVDIPVVVARIEFGEVDGGPVHVAPVELSGPKFRTLLLGMKGNRKYFSRIVAEGNGHICTSSDSVFETRPVGGSTPLVEREVFDESGLAGGFLILAGGVSGAGVGRTPTTIIDSEADVVWWASAPPSTSRARMSWEGNEMYNLSLNLNGNQGEFTGMTMDGLGQFVLPAALQDAQFDFTVAPGGVVTAIVFDSECGAVRRFTPGGEVETLVENLALLYTTGQQCRPNSIAYQPWSDTYTLSDSEAGLFVQFDRDGQLLWQFGGSEPHGDFFQVSDDWQGNWGHQLLEDGHLLFISNSNATQQSFVYEYLLDDSSWSASRTWLYEGDRFTSVLGDVQRLPNGNTLITYSALGEIHEVSPTGNVVQILRTTNLGYVMHRPTLYGPPSK